MLIILGCVALLTILVVAFLVTARTEFTTSNFYAKGVSTKLLSENVINLVMAQLREGARSTDVNTSAPQAWASQPGMIRTYDNTGTPSKYFKLYSWDNMIGTGQFDETQAAEIPDDDWASMPNVFTDLNEPITTADGIAQYPIIDPSAQGSVEGFSINSPPGATASNPLPMPVKWLYVLKNGSVTVGTKTGTGTAVTITGASVTNPVIGRVAFWTDDETSKVNINTASEGTFWDTPIGQGSEELGIPGSTTPPFGMSDSIPAEFEFQRVPGHPATTSLSAVFGYGTNPVLPVTGLEGSVQWPLTTSSYSEDFAPYYTITPRLTPGGSMGGAQQTPTLLTSSSYRLYDSVDELTFDPSRIPLTAGNSALYPAANGADPTGRPSFNPLESGLSAFTPSVIEQRRFFITAHSRAPEETLFGTPRISLWPLQADTNARTAKDNLLAFCSTISTEPYYFQRAQWYEYQPDSTGSPTVNATPSSQNPTADFPGPPTSTQVSPGVGDVARNENLYAYLQALTGENIPGFGGNFFDKYPGANGNPSDRDEILTEMFDLLRSGVNTFNTSPNIYPHYTASPFDINGYISQNAGSGSSIPISIPSNNTHGLGRTYSISEVSLVLMTSSMDLSGAGAGMLDPLTNPVASSSPPLFTLAAYNPPSPRRISIGSNLPWANEEDYPPSNHRVFLYYDPNTKTYGTYYMANLPGDPIGTPQKPYVYTVPPNTSTPLDITTAKAAIPVPIFCGWDISKSTYCSYFEAPTQDTTNAGKLFISPSPGIDIYNSQQYASLLTPTSLQPFPSTAATIGDPQTTAVQAFLLIKPYSVVVGPPAFIPNLRFRIKNLDQLTVSFPTIGSGTTQNLGFPAQSNAIAVCSSPNIYSSTGESTPDGGLWGICLGGAQTNQGPGSNPTLSAPWYNNGQSLTNYTYPFVGLPVPLPSAAYPSPFGGEDGAPKNTLTTPPPPTPVQIHNAGSASPNGEIYAGTSMVINSSAPGGVNLQIDVLDGVNSSNPTATPIVLQTVYVNIPQMTLPVPTVQMAFNEEWALGLQPIQNSQAGPRIPAYGGSPIGAPPSNPSYTDQYNSNLTFTYNPLDYYWQLPELYNPLNVYTRFDDPSGALLINRGDVVRSFDVNPNTSVAGDMRLLQANPIQSPTTATGSSNDTFIPLGSARTNSTDPLSNYTSLPTQGPWTSLFIKQLHSLIMDDGEGRSMFSLVQTSEPILVGTGSTAANPIDSDGSYAPNVNMGQAGGGPGMYETGGALIPGEHYPAESCPEVTPELNGAFMDPISKTIPGDWTLGPGPDGDGPYISKPDEGWEVPTIAGTGGQNNTYYIPYYATNVGNVAMNLVNTSYSPNRQVPSAVIFGGLPSRVFGGLTSGSAGGTPWCTLLFCPNPAANDAGAVHPGFGDGSTGNPGPNDYPPYTTPPDHLLLDLFWMPIVEPYAISEPFSTAGKVNMNYEIVPFGGYIHRSTAMHAVMKSTRILAIPTIGNDGDGNTYSSSSGYIPPSATIPTSAYYARWPAVKTSYGHPTAAYGTGFDFSYRYGINLTATIDDEQSAFYQRFKTAKDIFRSATEICNIFLVPEAVPGRTYYSSGAGGLPPLPTDASYASMTAWWKSFKLTGDNGRESPYNQIYPRLTTKSNDFEVHMRVQVLSQTPGDRANGTFDTTAGDSIVGEYRGSAIVERYLDPNQTGLPDFATTFPSDPTSTVDNYIHYRIVNTHAFNP